MKIGIMGGTFDPIHNAHLMLAEMACEEFGLDRVLFMTSGNPPHKRGEPMLDCRLRHEMMCLAIDGNDRFVPYDYEVKKSTYSYTSHTLKHLNEEYKDDTLYFIIGGDSLRDFHTWHKPEEIAKLCVLLVFERYGQGTDINDDVRDAREKYGADVRILNAPYFVISSSMLRERIKNGETVRYLMPDKVIEYINEHNLYR